MQTVKYFIFFYLYPSKLIFQADTVLNKVVGSLVLLIFNWLALIVLEFLSYRRINSLFYQGALWADLRDFISRSLQLNIHFN